MAVTPCNIPKASVLDSPLIGTAYFKDAYCAPLRSSQASLVDVFFAIFGHNPWWIKLTLVARNRIAALCGLAVPLAADILHAPIKSSCTIGEKIGPWPIFALTQNELVAGRDNSHLDFRLFLLRVIDGGVASVVVSTVCTTHNAFGKVYLFFIVPFHRWGVQWLMAKAVEKGRL
jgi:hypothetical protein